MRAPRALPGGRLDAQADHLIPTRALTPIDINNQTFDSNAAAEAAVILWETWRLSGRIDHLPARCRPRNRAEGYAIQREVARLSGQPVAGWKIAATSAAGQRHIGVDGPLAGRLLSGRLVAPGSTIDLTGNAMRVAEAEFAFRMATSLPKRSAAYTAVESRGRDRLAPPCDRTA